MHVLRRLVLAFAVLASAAPSAWAAQPEGTAAETRAALAAMHAWTKGGGRLEGWSDYLLSAALEAQLAKGRMGDRAVLREVLARYRSGVEGLDRPHFVAVRAALERHLEEIDRPRWADLAAACRQAKERFRPLSADDVREVHAPLVAAARRLDEGLVGANAAAWREYLRWPVLAAQLAAPEPDLAQLDLVHARLASGEPGLELPLFADVRRALRQRLVVGQALATGKLEEAYRRLLERLAERLETLDADLSSDAALEIGLACGWLAEARQAPELRRTIEARFARPNLRLMVSQRLLDAALGGPVDETTPLADVILDATVRGTDRTRGHATVELMPSEAAAEFDIVFRGTTHTDSTSYANGATVQSVSTTAIEARKRIRSDGRRCVALPAQASADVNTTLQGVNPGRGGSRAQQEAWRRAQAQSGQSDRIASDRARDKTAARMDQEVGRQIAALDRQLDERFVELEGQGVRLGRLAAFSTSQALHWTALQASESQLGAPRDPPGWSEGADLATAIHESSLNNAAQRALPGRRLAEDDLRQWFSRQFGPSPERRGPDPQSDPWSVQLAQQAPLSVRFAEGQCSLTLRGDRFWAEGQEFPGLDVTIAYRLAGESGRAKAVRQEGIKVYPRGFVPGGDARLSARQQALRTILERRLAKLFDAEWSPGPLALGPPWDKAGPLPLAHWRAEMGWLVLAWKR